jgi:NLR family CARD domain-containing protein 3
MYSYTGPEYIPMNAILRSYPPEILDILLGNTMSTTLFCVASALKKLAKGTEVPEGGKVYRGLGKMLLPRQFWVPHGSPAWRGGVERAFMSTTTDKDVAMFYTGGRGTVVEISVGRIQNGGDVSWISMVLATASIKLFSTCTASSRNAYVQARLQANE